MLFKVNILTLFCKCPKLNRRKCYWMNCACITMILNPPSQQPSEFLFSRYSHTNKRSSHFNENCVLAKLSGDHNNVNVVSWWLHVCLYNISNMSGEIICSRSTDERSCEWQCWKVMWIVNNCNAVDTCDTVN